MSRGLALELIHRHVGRVGVVCGGGPSLPEQLARCPEDAIYVSANQHGCLIRKCDYIMMVDGIESREFERADGSKYTLRDFGTPIISPRPCGDYWLFEQPVPGSGLMGAVILWAMGCAPILPAGMDCYRGPTYYHDPDAKSSGKTISPARHLDRWASLPVHAPGGQFRALGGPLSTIFPPYDPAEAPAAAPNHARVVGMMGGVWVQFTHACSDIVAPRMFAPGDRVELSAKLARRCVQRGFARFLEECTV